MSDACGNWWTARGAFPVLVDQGNAVLWSVEVETRITGGMVVQGWGSRGVRMGLRLLWDDTRMTPLGAVDEGFGLGTCRGARRDGFCEQPGSRWVSTRTRVWA
jgi:hypothetical protein